MLWLVTGGAGYIGAHVVESLIASGFDVTVLDDLSSGLRHRVPERVRLVEGSTLDPSAVADALDGVQGVVHLAARKAVAESVAQPARYYRENVGGLAELVHGMAGAGVQRLIFSSSAAVYGTPERVPIREDDPTVPESPYGETKLVGEWLVRAAGRAYGMRHLSLRYFNVAGAGRDDLGDEGVDNLVPLALAAVSEGRRPQVFGADYLTPDGSCVRDYVHVADVAAAHTEAVRLLDSSETSTDAYNIGTGRGYSVFEVLQAVADVTGTAVRPEVVSRRPGDPATVVADATRLTRDSGWSALRDLHDMVASAWSAWPAQR